MAVPTVTPLTLQTAPAKGSVTVVVDAINTTAGNIVLTFSVAGEIQEYRINSNNVRGEEITISNGAELRVVAGAVGVFIAGSAVYEGPQSS